MTDSNKYNLNEQLDATTNIPKTTIDEFDELIEQILSYDLYDAKLNNKSSAIVDLGFGRLKMTMENDEVKYYFIPSKSLDKSIKYALNCKYMVLINRIEKRVTDAMQEYYKELLS